MVHPPDFAAVARALDLLQSEAALEAEARDCLTEQRRAPTINGLPDALAGALRAARGLAAARVLSRADAALWAAAERCQAGWAEHVGWQRLERELTPAERQAACVSGQRGRKLQTAWRDARARRL